MHELREWQCSEWRSEYPFAFDLRWTRVNTKLLSIVLYCAHCAVLCCTALMEVRVLNWPETASERYVRRCSGEGAVVQW